MKEGREKNNRLWAIHSWVGLYAGVVIAILSITGAAAVFIPEIDRALNASLLRVEPQPGQVALPDLTRQLKDRYAGRELSSLSLPLTATDVYTFRFEKESIDASDSKYLDVHVNPHTGAIIGERDYYRSFAFFLRNLHVRLFENWWGRQMVGLFGIALVISTVTGMLIYGRFMKKQLFASIRRGRGIRIVAADWHKLVGVLALLFNLMIALTGAWLGLQPKIMSWTGMKTPNQYKATTPVVSAEEDKALPVDFAAHLRMARQYFPELVPATISASTNGAREVQIYGDTPGLVYERNIQKIVLDKLTGEVKFKYNVRRAALKDKVYYVQEALHFGDFGGLFLKIIYALFGLTTGGLSITGYIIYLKRNEKKGSKKEIRNRSKRHETHPA